MTRWNKVAIVGVGLIGGSIGLGLLRRRLAKEVVGVGRRAVNLRRARQMRAVSTATTSLERGVRGADLIVICTPVERIVETACRAAAACGTAALITDVGSTKAEVVESLDHAARRGQRWPTDVRFVGSHPLSGSEKSGVENASPALFKNRVAVITPSDSSTEADCQALTEFWGALGARVVSMPADEHDRAIAATSHLPHLAAAAIAHATPEQYLTLTAGGWLDTTRVAAGDPDMWRQILLSNRANVSGALEELGKVLGQFGRALAQGDAAELEALLTQAKLKRDAVAS